MDTQRPHPAHPEEQLLAQAVLGVPAIQPVRHVAVVLRVLLDVGVEEQQRDAAHVGDEDAGEQVWSARHGDRDSGARPVGLTQELEGELVGIEDGIGLLLPAVARQRLLEVAVPIEQPDPTTGMPRSDAALRWSPARIPRPPEYCGSTAVMPYSGEK
ncbi:hypothetical protein [Nocardioides piscis]|uniref:hypothetical protein n=1 Tax=Nocardioides piscis TaxID=2714938 RepID=UPI0031B5DADE